MREYTKKYILQESVHYGELKRGTYLSPHCYSSICVMEKGRQRNLGEMKEDPIGMEAAVSVNWGRL
jgi:hypothetical protein